MQYRYFLIDNGAGVPHEIYRSLPFETLLDAGLERAKRDGSWSGADEEVKVVLDLWMRGDFGPRADEITEEEAGDFLSGWRLGSWPGRP
jgi:hypothetical protein